MVEKIWRPLNLINCVGKLSEKVVVEKIWDYGGELFHRLQYGSVTGWWAVNILNGLLRKACKCIYEGSSIRWGI